MAERRYTLDDLDWLLDTAADYLVEQATSESGPVYRLYHQALAEYLQSAKVDEEPARLRRLFAALVGEVHRHPDRADRDWSTANPYLTRHLAAHAVDAGLLDDLLEDPGFMLAADPARLLRTLANASTPTGRQAAGVYRLSVHQFRGRPVEQAAFYLLLAARQQRADHLADRIERIGLAQPWSVRWAAWQAIAAHHILGQHTGAVNAVAVAKLDGRPVVVSGSSDQMVRVWDLSSGSPVGEPWTGHTAGVYAVAVGALDGRAVVVSGGGDATVRVWDLSTGNPVCEPFTAHSASLAAVAVGELDGRPVVVSGGTDETVRVWDLRTRQALAVPVEIGAAVKAIICMSSSRILVATQRGLVLLQLTEDLQHSHNTDY